MGKFLITLSICESKSSSMACYTGSICDKRVLLDHNDDNREEADFHLLEKAMEVI